MRCRGEKKRGGGNRGLEVGILKGEDTLISAAKSGAKEVSV